METKVALIEGFYFLLTGLWPLISMRTFLKVTGPKTDLWLVKTVGLMLAVIGLVLVSASFQERIISEIMILGISVAAALSMIDVIYGIKGVISKIYLVDAGIESLFIFGLIVSLLRA